MSPSIEEQIIRLKNTIAEMEAQRGALGDTVVQKAVDPLREKLEELNALLASRESPPPTEPVQQRKLVTLLFMDIVGSTSISQYLDPEDVSEVLDGTLKKLAQPVEVHGGHLTRFMGDGFLAVFGAPQAHEDDPAQAIRAGLAIIEAAQDMAPELQAAWGIPSFQVRVGINTGLVLLGGETEAEDTLMGAPVNLAARLESAAPPGGLLISHNTYQHVKGIFNVERLEPITVKGFNEPVAVYRVLSNKPRAFRLYTRGVEGVETRMVGRHDELKYLQDALLTAIEEGEGQLVTLTGDAGVGKSRLLYEFQDWIELLPPPAVRFFEGRALQEAQELPYGLLRDLFEFRFQIQDDDSAEIAREKMLAGFGEVFAEEDAAGGSEMRTHILGQLLGYDFSVSPHLRSVLGDAEQLRNRGWMYLLEYFQRLSDRVPVVVFLEDIHWGDDSSLDALNWLGERLHHQRLLIVSTARPTLFERRPYWGEGLPYHRRLALEPLSMRESRQLVGEIFKLATDIPLKLRELLVESAEGNPFYLEELVKMLVEGGIILTDQEAWRIEPERLTEIEVPPTLAGVLQARLDSLSVEERTILQQASVVGRQFWDRVVAHIQASMEAGESHLPEALTALRQRELIFRRESSAFADAREYIFKHDILREVTYESVLKRLRRKYHGMVADWLISQVGNRAGEYSGMIANHMLLAGRRELAGAYSLQAGQAAMASNASHEAERYFRQALELSLTGERTAACMAGLAEALGRQGHRDESMQAFRQGIDLYLELDAIDIVADLYARLSWVTWRYDYPGAWQVCQEALKRLAGAPESPGMARLLAEAGRVAHFHGQSSEEVTYLCQQAIEMAESCGELQARAEASITIAVACVNKDPEKALPLLREAVAFSEANELWHPAARAHTNLSFSLSYLFESIESAYQHSLRATELFKRIGDIDMLFFVLWGVTEEIHRLGIWEAMEDTLLEIFQNSATPQARMEEFLDEQRSLLSSPRGEWIQALEFHRHQLDVAREKGNIQEIVSDNLDLAAECLELNRFTGMADLTEAEAALLENIQLDWDAIQSRFRMVVLLSRQARFTQARKWLAEVIDDLEQPLSKPYEVFRYDAEAELARAEERWEEAVSACQALVDIYRGCEYRWGWARQLIDLGDSLLGRGESGDNKRAEQVYRQSLKLYTEMGAPGYIRVLEERLRGFETQSIPEDKYL